MTDLESVGALRERAERILASYHGNRGDLAARARDLTQSLALSLGEEQPGLPRPSSERNSQRVKDALPLGFRIHGGCRPSWLLALEALKCVTRDPDLAERLIRRAEQIIDSDSVEVLIERARQKRSGPKKRPGGN